MYLTPRAIPIHANGAPLVWIGLWLLVALAQSPVLAATPLTPTHDGQVLELLSVVTRSRANTTNSAAPLANAANAATAALAARQNITLARQTGDTRYWGRAQALLAPWWDASHAPVDLAVLQATVHQGRHEFDASRRVLTAALQRQTEHAQGWLNLAALNRLSGRYADALLACEAVDRAGQALYAQACRLETQSLQGQHQQATAGLQTLVAQSADKDQQSWLLSLLAESLERAGRDAQSLQAYRHSLALGPDLYTSIALSDLLLRTQYPQLALDVLASQPETDAVLIRRASAWKQLGDGRWHTAHSVLQARAKEVLRRGDDPALHGRELAQIALLLEGNAAKALPLASANLQLQREPLDWRVALLSARAAKDVAAQAALWRAMLQTGLVDARLQDFRPKGTQTDDLAPGAAR